MLVAGGSIAHDSIAEARREASPSLAQNSKRRLVSIGPSLLLTLRMSVNVSPNAAGTGVGMGSGETGW